MSGMDAVIDIAALHKPHVAIHTYQNFIDKNVTGTLNLLQTARRHRVKALVYTSTTSTFGDMLTPKKKSLLVQTFI